MSNLIESYTPEWYEQRVGRFTASRLSELLTKPRGKYHSIVLEKVGEILTGQSADNTFMSEEMQRGLELEPLAIKWAERNSGLKMEAESYFKTWDECDAFGATCDRVGMTDDGHKVIVEVKCPKTKTHIEYCCLIESADDLKEVNKGYYWQIVAGAIVHDARYGLFVSFDDRINEDCGLFLLFFEIPEEDIETGKAAILKAVEQRNYLVSTFKNN
jgi:hypothetical protein